MLSSRFVKALLLPAAAVAAIAAPLLGSSPASAATCAADPLNGVCVSTTSTTVRTETSKVAVQATPKTGNVTRYIAAGSSVAVICQTINAGNWSAISTGGWVLSTSLNLTIGTDGYTTGIRHCGIAAPTGVRAGAGAGAHAVPATAAPTGAAAVATGTRPVAARPGAVAARAVAPGTGVARFGADGRMHGTGCGGVGHRTRRSQQRGDHRETDRVPLLDHLFVLASESSQQVLNDEPDEM